MGQIVTPYTSPGGEPREKALALLQEYEAHERGMYAAPLALLKDVPKTETR